jgi:hypothetical protein
MGYLLDEDGNLITSLPEEKEKKDDINSRPVYIQFDPQRLQPTKQTFGESLSKLGGGLIQIGCSIMLLLFLLPFLFIVLGLLFS